MKKMKSLKLGFQIQIIFLLVSIILLMKEETTLVVQQVKALVTPGKIRCFPGFLQNFFMSRYDGFVPVLQFNFKSTKNNVNANKIGCHQITMKILHELERQLFPCNKM